MKAIIDAAHKKFMNSTRLPDDSKETQVYLILHGLDTLLSSKGIEVTFDIEDLDIQKPDIGGLDDIG